RATGVGPHGDRDRLRAELLFLAPGAGHRADDGPLRRRRAARGRASARSRRRARDVGGGRVKSFLATAPILIPLATGLACALTTAPRARRALAYVGGVALLAATTALVVVVGRDGALRLSIGSWDAPFGIELFVDALAAPMTLITAVVT